MYSKAIIVLTIVVLVLVIVASFFVLQTGPQVSRADANRVFAAQCQNYAQRGCSWDVTHEPQFSAYLDACRAVHGAEREASTCLYALCDGCKQFALSQARCDGLCNLCKGNAAAGIDATSCVAQYEAQCAGSCGV